MPTMSASKKAAMIASAKRFAASLTIAIVVLALGGFGLYLAANQAEFSSSWLLGFGGAIGLALVLGALYLTSHEVSGRSGGVVIGFVTIVLAIIGWNWVMPIDQFDGGDFTLGLLDVGLILASATAINMYKNHTTT